MIPRIQAMVELLEQYHDGSGPINELDLTEYRRYKAELLDLQTQLYETVEQLRSINTTIEKRYPVIFRQWRTDLIGLNASVILLKETETSMEDVTVPNPL